MNLRNTIKNIAINENMQFGGEEGEEPSNKMEISQLLRKHFEMMLKNPEYKERHDQMSQMLQIGTDQNMMQQGQGQGQGQQPPMGGAMPPMPGMGGGSPMPRMGGGSPMGGGMPPMPGMGGGSPMGGGMPPMPPQEDDGEMSFGGEFDQGMQQQPPMGGMMGMRKRPPMF